MHKRRNGYMYVTILMCIHVTPYCMWSMSHLIYRHLVLPWQADPGVAAEIEMAPEANLRVCISMHFLFLHHLLHLLHSTSPSRWTGMSDVSDVAVWLWLFWVSQMSTFELQLTSSPCLSGGNDGRTWQRPVSSSVEASQSKDGHGFTGFTGESCRKHAMHPLEPAVFRKDKIIHLCANFAIDASSFYKQAHVIFNTVVFNACIVLVVH